MMKTSLVLMLVSGLAGSGLASAQSLGDVAKQEEARRAQTKSTGKTYTNANLPDGGKPSVPPATSQPASAGAAGAVTATAAGTPGTNGAAGSPTADAPPPPPDPVKEAEIAKAKKEAEAKAAQQKAQNEATRARIAELRAKLDSALASMNQADLKLAANSGPSSAIAKQKDEASAAVDTLRQQLAMVSQALEAAEQNPEAATMPLGGLK